MKITLKDYKKHVLSLKTKFLQIAIILICE